MRTCAFSAFFIIFLSAVFHVRGWGTAPPCLKREGYSALLADYLAIKDALVRGNEDLAEQKGAAMGATLSQWKGADCLQALKESLSAYRGAADISERRSVFSSLSEDVYSLAKAHPNEQTLYKQYCPMALDSRGAGWLSLSKKIENPYFGAAMLKCGSIKERIEVAR